MSDREWIVLKFGGTSVSTANRWGVICNQVNKLKEARYKVWVVISALSQVTNLLQTSINEAVHDANHLTSFERILNSHITLSIDCGLLKNAEREMFINTVMTNVQPEANIARFEHVIAALQMLKKILDGIQLTGEASPKLEARILAHGELLSTQLGMLIMKEFGVAETQYVDARQYLICPYIDNAAPHETYLHADVASEQLAKFDRKAISQFSVVLTQGFIASTSQGHTCLLGRGGSDTSASLFGVLVHALRVEIWTDVHGLFTSDPRCVPEARLIRQIDFRQAQELAAMGAKVLHPRCIVPAQWAGIPIHIRNTNDPSGEYTEIVHAHSRKKITESSAPKPQIMAVVKRCNMTLLTLTAYDMCGASGFLSKAFVPFEQLGISVDLIATSQYSVSLTLDHIPGGVDGESFKVLLKRLEAFGCKVNVKHPCASVSIVGRELRRTLYCLGSVLEKLEGHECYLVSESAEDLNLSFVVDESSADSIVKAMHSQLFHNKDIKNRVRSESMEEVLGSTWTILRSNTGET